MIDHALRFLETTDHPMGLNLVRYLKSTEQTDRDATLTALACYQNADGGFGNGLEVDIQAPQSNPFAARLAMQVLLTVGATANDPIVQRLATWLEQEQGDDGCWRFTPEIFEHELAPWFAAWTFPSLNPALNLAGLSHQLGIGSDHLFVRVAELTARLASIDAIESGEFYDLLPYAEYFPWVTHPHQAQYLDALAARITSLAKQGKYEDAGHYFNHIGPLDGPVARRLDPHLIKAQLERLRDEQEDDGGWPSPYSSAWRPWITAEAVTRLVAAERQK